MQWFYRQFAFNEEQLTGLSFHLSSQTGLTGCTCGDMKKMFAGDNVATHLSDLFDHTSQTYSISANIHVCLYMYVCACVCVCVCACKWLHSPVYVCVCLWGIHNMVSRIIMTMNVIYQIVIVMWTVDNNLTLTFS